MCTFREWNCKTLTRHFDAFGEKLERVINNSSVRRISEVTSTPTTEEFRVVYNWFTQLIIEDRVFVRDVIARGSIKPADIMRVLLGRLHSKDHHLSTITPEADPRVAARYYASRVLCEQLGDRLGVQVEESIAKHQASGKQYRKQCLRVISNLLNANTRLKDRLVDGTELPERLGDATHKELWPELWESASMQPGHRAIITRESDTIVSESLIKCSACKNHTVQTTEFQTRSADEPMTIFCNCTTCGKRWKM